MSPINFQQRIGASPPPARPVATSARTPEPISVQTRNVFEADAMVGNTLVSNNGALEVALATGLGTILGMGSVKAPGGLRVASSFLVAGTPAGVGAATALMLNQDTPNKLLAGMLSGAVTGAVFNGVLQGNLKGAAIGAAIGAATGGAGAAGAVGLGQLDDLWSRVAGAF